MSENLKQSTNSIDVPKFQNFDLDIIFSGLPSVFTSTGSLFTRVWNKTRYDVNLFMQLPGAIYAVVLFLILLVTLFGATLLAIVSTSNPKPFGEEMLDSWKYLLDPSEHFEVDDSLRFGFSIVITIVGLLLMSTITGFVADQVINYMEHLRLSAGPIVEAGHFLVLGWNDKLPGFIYSCAFSENGTGTIVILSKEEKDYMEHAIANMALPKNHKLRIVATKGNPMNPKELSRVSVIRARSVILLSDSQNPDQADADNIAKAMAVLSFPDFKGFIVADMITSSLFKLIKTVTHNRAVPILSNQLTGRLIAQCGRQPGISSVYLNILDFKEMDFYFTKSRKLVGKTFIEAIHLIDDGGILCGIFKCPAGNIYTSSAENLVFNPPDNYVIEKSDSVIVLARDMDKFSFKKNPRKWVDSSAAREWIAPEKLPKHFLFVGWRHDMDEVFKNLLPFMPAGSTLTILSAKPIEERKMDTQSSNVEVIHVIGNPLNPKDIWPFLKEGSEISSILILNGKPAVSSKEESEAADNITLVSTLMINDLLMRANRIPQVEINANIRQTASLEGLSTSKESSLLISEINDPEKMELVSDFARRRGDWIVGNQMVGMTLAQLAHSYNNRFVFDELLTSRGHEIYMKDPRRYCDLAKPISFFELMIRGRNVTKSDIFPLGREIIIGYKRKDELSAIINPKNKTEELIFQEGDLIVTIAAGIYSQE